MEAFRSELKKPLRWEAKHLQVSLTCPFALDLTLLGYAVSELLKMSLPALNIEIELKYFNSYLTAYSQTIEYCFYVNIKNLMQP